MKHCASARLFVGLLALLFLVKQGFADNRVALVIGNEGYGEPAAGAKVSATAMAALLKGVGYKVFGGRAQLELHESDLLRAIGDFASEARSADEAVIYFAGHVSGSGDATAVAPIEIRGNDQPSELSQSIALASLGFELKPAYGHLVIVLDASRGTPGESGAAAGRGAIPAPPGVSVVMAELSNKSGIGISQFVNTLAERLKPVRGDLAALYPPAQDDQAAEAATNGQTDEQPANDPNKKRGGVIFRAGPASERPYNVVEVYFGTDRSAAKSASGAVIFGSKPGPLSYGHSLISIPRDHRLGLMEEATAIVGRPVEDPNKHVLVLKTEVLPADSFFSALADHASQSGQQSAFIFVHGYNVSFEDAARRTAQMAYDLKFTGAPIFFSWPSAGTFTSYGSDEQAVEIGRSDLLVFLRTFLERSSAKEVYLICHSMGSRAMTGAAEELLTANPEYRSRIKEIILAAPDINAEVFKAEIAPKLTEGGTAVTLYASANDWALRASKFFHSFPRAGEIGPGTVAAAGVTTIDSSSVNTSFLGHSYYAESRSIIGDIFSILAGQVDPSSRHNLVKVDAPPMRYWKLVP